MEPTAVAVSLPYACTGRYRITVTITMQVDRQGRNTPPLANTRKMFETDYAKSKLVGF